MVKLSIEFVVNPTHDKATFNIVFSHEIAASFPCMFWSEVLNLYKFTSKYVDNLHKITIRAVQKQILIY